MSIIIPALLLGAVLAAILLAVAEGSVREAFLIAVAVLIAGVVAGAGSLLVVWILPPEHTTPTVAQVLWATLAFLLTVVAMGAAVIAFGRVTRKFR